MKQTIQLKCTKNAKVCAVLVGQVRIEPLKLSANGGLSHGKTLTILVSARFSLAVTLR